MDDQNFSESVKLKGVVQLLKESWQIYRSKIKILLGIVMMPVIFSLLVTFVPWFPEFPAFIFVGILSLAAFLFWLLAVPTLIYAIKENTGIKESYQKGFKIFISYLWVAILVDLIATGGFLLFVIPGILFSIWFSLAIYVLIFEEKKGMSALLRSKDLISGKWWLVFWRFLVLIAIIFVVILVIVFLFKTLGIEQAVNVLNPVFQLFITPFILIYGILIFKDLKSIKAEILYQNPSFKRKIKYALVGILGIPLLIIGLLNVSAGKDELPPDDSDLWLSKVEISRENNAFYYLVPYFGERAQEIILEYCPDEKGKLGEPKEIYQPSFEERKLIDEIIEGKEWDEEFIKELLKNNEQVLKDFEKVVQCPYFQDPIIQDPGKLGITTPLLSLSEPQKMAELNLIKAIYLFKQGKEEQAFDETIGIIEMGQLIEDSPRGYIISYLVGLHIKEMGLEQLRIMLSTAILPPKIFKKYINRLDKFKLNEEGLGNVLKIEYINLINNKANIIDVVASGEKPELETMVTDSISPISLRVSYFYKPNQTKRFIGEHFRFLVGSVDENYKEYQEKVLFEEVKLAQFLPYYYPGMIALFRENSIGKMISGISLVSLDGLFAKKCEEDFSIIGTQLLMAVKAYQIETGRLPNSLNELVPEYISEIPKDPFDGNLIRYSADKKMIYSVGGDLKDSGGSEGEKLSGMEDPTFKIEF